jgi:hypothetical protein
VARSQVTKEEDFLDAHARRVHQFSLQMTNLGLARMADLLIAMLDADDWREFTDGLGTYRFLSGEFDYFLTQRGIDRDQILHGIRDIDVKAKLEAAMDERRTGEAGYRRRLADVRREVPTRPGRPIEPFGYTQRESKTLLETALGESSFPARRPALGSGVRRWANSGGQATRPDSELRPRWERLARSAVRLPDQELAKVVQALHDELDRRTSASRPTED